MYQQYTTRLCHLFLFRDSSLQRHQNTSICRVNVQQFIWHFMSPISITVGMDNCNAYCVFVFSQSIVVQYEFM